MPTSVSWLAGSRRSAISFHHGANTANAQCRPLGPLLAEAVHPSVQSDHPFLIATPTSFGFTLASRLQLELDRAPDVFIGPGRDNARLTASPALVTLPIDGGRPQGVVLR